MLERTLQKNILQHCKKEGILAVKVETPSINGWPDLLVILRNGVVLLVEVKTETGRLSPAQKRLHDKLEKQNARIYTIRTLEAFKALTASFVADPCTK